jgi:hypothetical protein
MGWDQNIAWGALVPTVINVRSAQEVPRAKHDAHPPIWRPRLGTVRKRALHLGEFRAADVRVKQQSGRTCEHFPNSLMAATGATRANIANLQAVLEASATTASRVGNDYVKLTKRRR